MFKFSTLALACLATAALPQNALAAEATSLQELKQELDNLRQSYEVRTRDLETRLLAAERNAAKPATTASASASSAAEPTPARKASNSFNPAVSLVLSGGYANLSKNPDEYQISNFISGGEIGPGKRGFSLGETELSLSANIDQNLYGAATFAVTPESEIEVEEAFVQTTALPYGLGGKVGRFFSGIGYQNSQHAHTWDFVDAPLAYQAFLGGKFGQDGVQVRWLAPTPFLLELGGELGSGGGFPGAERNKNGAGASSLFAHVGGDIGASHSWRAGLSWLQTRAQARSYDTTDLLDQEVANEFSGRSRLWLADFVWKWSPNGDASRTNLKLQGEYFQRRERGVINYDTDNTASDGDYASRQSGWYVQSVYQFMPRWRAGLRYDQLSSGSVSYGDNDSVLANSQYSPRKTSLILDWASSEFSRLRLQVARDQSREGKADRQIMLQYQMSLGAHGAHAY